LILSRIGYCNSILICLPASSTALLQRLQNVSARLVMGLRAPDHVTSALSSLHWLSIHYRIQNKVAFTIFFIHTHQCPLYLSEIIVPLHSNTSRQPLRSSTNTNNLIPWTRTKLGEPSFSVAGELVQPPGTIYLKLFSPSPMRHVLNMFLKLIFSISLLNRRIDIVMPHRSG